MLLMTARELPVLRLVYALSFCSGPRRATRKARDRSRRFIPVRAAIGFTPEKALPYL